MGRSQETFNKRENAKKKLQRKKEKQQRREEKRQASADNKGKSLDDMLAYVDENGNISTTPPDPEKKRKPVAAEEIIISTPKLEELEDPNAERTGRISHFNEAKGYGFITDSDTGERVFFHVNDLEVTVADDDRVIFTAEKNIRGLQATSVKLKDKPSE